MVELDQISKIDRVIAKKHFRSFVKYTKDDYEFNWHHDYICKKLQDFADGKINRLMIFVPPRHGKSELASRRFPAWLFGRDPNIRIISTSYAADLSSTFNRNVQNIIDSNRYRELFPNTCLNGSAAKNAVRGNYVRNSTEFEIVGHNGSYVSAGVGGSITGKGGDVLIIDDPFKNYEEASSPVIRRKVWEWYTSTLYTRQEKNSRIMLIQTRWHEDDLAGLLINQMKLGGEFSDQWEVVEFPAILEKETPNDPRKIGQALWETKYSSHWMRVTKKVMGTFQFSALYQQSPTPDEGMFIKASWLKTYDEKPDAFDRIIQSWDMSFGSTGPEASFVVGSVYGTRGANIYLLDQTRGQWDFTETIAQFRLMNTRWPKATARLVERKANGQAVIDTLSKEIPGIIPIDPEGSKESRLAACQPSYEAGNVLYPNIINAPWIDDHKHEIVSFPNGKFNDRVDAESQAINWLRNAGVGKFTQEMADLETSEFSIQKAEW